MSQEDTIEALQGVVSDYDLGKIIEILRLSPDEQMTEYNKFPECASKWYLAAAIMRQTRKRIEQ